MSTTIDFHTNKPTTVHGRHFDASPSSHAFDVIDLKQGDVTVSVFINETVATDIVVELKKLFPQLALPLGKGDIDALAERYADEHAGDVGVDGPVEVWHVVEPRTTGADIAAYNSRAVDLVARAAGLIR